MNYEDEDQESNIPLCKVILIGSTSVGKTSLINRYSFNKYSEHVMSTTGASFSTVIKHIENENCSIKFEIWDTIGQERFRSLSRLFYKEASIAILVYDLTKKQSFIDLKNIWLKEINENIGKNVTIAANKADLYENEEVNVIEGKNLAKENKAFFQTTSAKDNYGIEHLFQKLGQQFINPSVESLMNLEIERSRSTIKLSRKNSMNHKMRKCC